MARRTNNPAVGIGYLRVSTEDQKLGIEAQREAITAFAERHGIAVTAWYLDEGVSGGAQIDKRPALLDALAGLRTHRAGILLVGKRDRLARDVVVAATIERHAAAAGARIASADGTGNGDTPQDAFMRTVIDGASQYERALIRARVTAALHSKKGRGEIIGEAPFGWQRGDDGKTLVHDGAERQIIERVRDLRMSRLTLQAIVAALRAEGTVSIRSGKPFGITQVHRILKFAA